MVYDSTTSSARRIGASLFVGRERETAELRTGFEQACRGRGRLFLLSGEPGIGKTRIADELAAYAIDAGARVAWGRCWEGDGAPAYWPWVQVLRSCLGASGGEWLIEHALNEAWDIAQIVPELRPRLPAGGANGGDLHVLGAEQARFRLFDSVNTVLRNFAEAGPLVIVLDDLHDADQPSLLLLRFVAREIWRARILVVGTYRELDVRHSPVLGPLLGTIAREGVQISIAGLGEAAIAQMVQAGAGLEPNARLIESLRQITAGNPLFIDGVVRLVVAGGKTDALSRPIWSGLAMPDSVREAIRRQLDGLSSDARSILVAAAVIGVEFDLATLRCVGDVPHERVLDLLHEGIEARIITRVQDALSRYRFSHALIRGALYESISTSTRVGLHGEIAKALEDQYRLDLEPHLAELAYHFAEAASPGATEKAIDYIFRAAEAANKVFAYEDAVALLRKALAILEAVGAPADKRAEIMVQLGDIAGITDRAMGVDYLERALKLYEGSGRTDDAADVHSRLGAALSLVSGVSNIPLALEHFRKAELVLSQGPWSVALGRLYIGLAMVSEQTVDIGQGLTASAHAMEIGAQLRDEAVWTNAAVQHATYLLRSGRLAEAHALFDKAWEKADSLNQGFHAAWLGGYARMALLDPLDAEQWYRRELERPRMAQAPFLRRILEGSLAIVTAFSGSPRQVWAQSAGQIQGLPGGMVCLYLGDWTRAEALLTEGLENALRSGSRDEQFNYRYFLARLAIMHEDLNRAEALLEGAVATCPDGLHWLWQMLARPDLARINVGLGKLGRAREHIAKCREILAAGEDWRGLRGLAMRSEGIIAAAEGRKDEADANFAETVSVLRRYHVPFEEADTLFEWGRALVSLGAMDDATEKFMAAVELYRQVGAGEPLEQRVGVALERVLRSHASPKGVHGRGPALVGVEAILRKEGDFWTVGYKGGVSRIRDVKGLAYLAHLLAHPGTEFHSLDLAAGAALTADDQPAFADAREAVIHALGDAGEMLDDAAKAAYRRRIKEVQEEIEEAREFGDSERAHAAQEEIDALTQELSRAIGLHGRNRRSASVSERARLNVTRSVKNAIDRIAENHPELGALLTQTIRTGTFCCYFPDPRQPLHWSL